MLLVVDQMLTIINIASLLIDEDDVSDLQTGFKT